MRRHYDDLREHLKANPKTWLITGVAGFIGSNLLETLLKLGQRVVGLDNFSTGHRQNLDEVRSLVSDAQWSQFLFQEGDIRVREDCRRVLEGIDYVLHQAALGSVPRSIHDPVTTNSVNISGFLNMLLEARDANVTNFVYAASSSTYGDHPDLPKQEDRIGKPLSPYAVTKYVNELYADVFARTYGFGSTGLRYFNVFGPRQDPDGAYAAVIPKWVAAMLRDDPVTINGDGETSRDFCFVDNAVQANLLAAVYGPRDRALVLNVAKGDRTSLNELFEAIRSVLARQGIHYHTEPARADFRPGDVRHSRADISRAEELLGYQPRYDVHGGLRLAIDWYVKRLGPGEATARAR